MDGAVATGRRFALLIATDEYVDEGLRQLSAPAHDARALAEVLRDPDIAGFEVTTLVNAPHHMVGAAVGEFFNARGRDDLALLYFTGHGIKDDDGRLHLATVDTRLTNRMFTSVPAELVDRAMGRCASRQQVLILDCCYSGAFPAGQLAKGDADVHALEMFRGLGRTVLSASDAAQLAFEGDRLHGSVPRSVFTKHLVEGLREGAADLDGDGYITLDELYAYVYGKVVREMPGQRPKKLENTEGRTVIAENVNWSLPVQLQHLLHSLYATERFAGVEQLAHLYRNGNPRVRARAAEELRLLADDDSRRVYAAVAAVGLGGGPNPATEAVPADAPDPAAEADPAPAPDPAPAAAPDPADAPAPDAAPEPPPAPDPAAAPDPAELDDLRARAIAERERGALDRAEEHFWEYLDLALQHRDRGHEGWAWDGLGSCLYRAGHVETARRFFTRAERRADETGDTLLKSWCLYNFGLCRREHGDAPGARALFEQSVALADAHRHGEPARWSRHELAALTQGEGAS